VSEGGAERDAWFRVAFGAHYRALYAARDDASAEREAAFAAQAVGARAGARWLDAACGDGRHAAALHRAGFRVTAFDLSADLLQVARSRGLPRVVRADLRRPPFASAAFDVVGLFFTSFGYFDDATNLDVLRRLRALLIPGGRLLLDLPDVERLRATLVPESCATNELGRCVSRRRIAGDRVEKEVVIEPVASGLPPIRYVESVRLYAREEIYDLYRAVGFRAVAEYGDFRGSPPRSSDRAIHVAEAVI
jgi:SAM-dependent methyltransferase